MSEAKITSETRAVSNFDRVVLKEYGDLTITQGAQESITIEADEELLPRIKTEVENGVLTITLDHEWTERFSTQLNTRRIKYHLMIKNLRSLEISGAASVKAPEIKADRLELKVSGAANVSLGNISAQSLDVTLPGTGNLDLAGKVLDQTVVVSGAGMYRAPRLESQKTTIEITGLGKATVWAVTDLDVTITGLGSVRYYGEPRIKRNLHGLGKLQSLGNP